MATKRLTHWLSHAWDSEEDILFRYMEVAQEQKMPQDFDTLVGVGVSGAVIVPILARLLGVDFAIVRKDNDGTHGWNKIEGVVGSKWLFVDDLISSVASTGPTRPQYSHLSDVLKGNSLPLPYWLKLTAPIGAAI